MKDPADISGKGRERLSEERLQAYLEGRLSPKEQHEVELWLSEESMESDAVEGLKDARPEETRKAVSKINHGLAKKLGERRRRRRKPVGNSTWTLVAIVMIILLCVVAYMVLHISLH